MKITTGLPALLVIAGCSSAKGDFESFCPKLQEFLKSQAFQGANASEKATRVATWIDETFTSEPMKLTMGALASASPKDKYRMFQAAAAEVGVPDWECAEWEEIIGPTPASDLGSLCFAFSNAKLADKKGEAKEEALKAFFDEALSTAIAKGALQNPMSYPAEERWTKLNEASKKHTASELSCAELQAMLKPEPPTPVAPPENAKPGCRDKRSIQKTIRSKMSAIRYCYERELAKTPKLAGKIKVEFTINPDGAVSTFKALENTLNPTVEGCLSKVIKRMRFSGDDKCSGYTVIKYPFVFKSN